MKQINILYKKLMRIDPNNIDFLQKYGLFLKHIMFDEVTAAKIFDRAYILSEKSGLNRVFASKFGSKKDKLLIVRVSGKLGSLGKILDTNLLTLRKLKYEKNEFLRLSPNQLLPPNICEIHEKWILASYEKLIDPCENNILHGFIKDKDGYYIPCNLLIRLIPNLKEDINFLLTFELNQKFSNYIQSAEQNRGIFKVPCLFLCDDNNKIIGINRTAGEWINANPLEITGKAEVTMDTFVANSKDPEVEKLLLSNNGYTCEVNKNSIADQLVDLSPKHQEEGKEERINSICVKLIKETYGTRLNLPIKVKVFIVIPLALVDKGTLSFYL